MDESDKGPFTRLAVSIVLGFGFAFAIFYSPGYDSYYWFLILVPWFFTGFPLTVFFFLVIDTVFRRI